MTPNSNRGMIAAIALAGPAFLVGLALGGWSDHPDTAIDPSVLLAGFIVLPILGLVTIIGALIAFLPIMFGTALLRWIGRRNTAMQWPMMWLIVGAGIGGAAAAIAEGPAPLLVGLTFTGGICALIARWRVRWD